MPDPEFLRDWHPLDHTPAPEYILPQWDGPHVGKRLAEALRTLRYMPVNGCPVGFTNSWPAILHEYSDRAAYEDDPIWKAERAAESNRTKPRPSSIEIARMETAIVWPARYLDHVPQLLRTVQAVAVARARERDIAHAARKLGLPSRLTRRWNGEGLDLIAAGLRRDAVAVF
jgi:hypothetical protein